MLSMVDSERSDDESGFPVVAIGASAGGLEAISKLLETLPAECDMAYVLVQHLEPHHKSLLTELLAAHTQMKVCEISDGMTVEANRLHIIPPGRYLSYERGVLSLSPSTDQRSPRLPFDVLLDSLASGLGSRTIAVVLSGTGADGSQGIRAVQANHGLVVVQDPKEAEFDGMPRSAILTGMVDLVLPIKDMASAITAYGKRILRSEQRHQPAHASGDDPVKSDARFDEVIELLRVQTGTDLRFYKEGTLHRRIERRMAMTGIELDRVNQYVERLRSDNKELQSLARDIFIKVTGFFRDPEIFQHIADDIAPRLVAACSIDQPLRIWVAGCSTGEEAYSIAIVVHEAIRASKRNIKLKIFASDIDSGAVTKAREGIYPESIDGEISPERLAKFFIREGLGYRVTPMIRRSIVFSVQNVLEDPPFSRLDMVSCRNLLIYLHPEAQARALSVFHFALRQQGVLILGSAENLGSYGNHFDAISKEQRTYHKVARSQPLAHNIGRTPQPDDIRLFGRQPSLSRLGSLAEMCRRLVIDAFAPAAILINSAGERIFSLGPTDRFIRVTQGFPTNDLMALARTELRVVLKSVIEEADRATGGRFVKRVRIYRDDRTVDLTIEIRPVVHDGESYRLIFFVQHDERKGSDTPLRRPESASKLRDLEDLQEQTKQELNLAYIDLERINAEHKAIYDEMLSINEEYQSTNEELLTSKEELQSLNEALNALNNQLNETLERQRTATSDLQSVLYSINVAMLFLDQDLKIRFFTPALISLFRLIPGDIGRPLADLQMTNIDRSLLRDSRAVMEKSVPVTREFKMFSDVWIKRHIVPYQNQNREHGGVVVTFSDISEQKRASAALEAALLQADKANKAKSRFLAVASHDLRQPLQTLTLLQESLAKDTRGKPPEALVGRLVNPLKSMKNILDTLLDINQIEAGKVSVHAVDFPVDVMLSKLGKEYASHAQARGLELRTVPCSVIVHSDPSLLEAVLRNLISNALNYTPAGKLLIGCRRGRDSLGIEVWDTGIGIPEDQHEVIFDEYYQLDNAAREHSQGLGLGLYIVRRLVDLLGHRISVRSKPAMGSAFRVDVSLGSVPERPGPDGDGRDRVPSPSSDLTPGGAILIVDNDPAILETMGLVLKAEGFTVALAHDGPAARDLVAGGFQPDLLIADHHLPRDMSGLALGASLRESTWPELPVIILTGDISSASHNDIAASGFRQLNKPAGLETLTNLIAELLSAGPSRPPARSAGDTEIVYIVDDDVALRDALRLALDDRDVRGFATAEAFLRDRVPDAPGCVMVDAYLPGMSGLELLQEIKNRNWNLPAIMITGNGDVEMAVAAIKSGAIEFIEKPASEVLLRAAITQALQSGATHLEAGPQRQAAVERLSTLTPRQREVLEMVLAGHPSKNIAADLDLSQRTVEHHRAQIMKRSGADSLADLVRLGFAAGLGEAARN